MGRENYAEITTETWPNPVVTLFKRPRHAAVPLSGPLGPAGSGNRPSQVSRIEFPKDDYRPAIAELWTEARL